MGYGFLMLGAAPDGRRWALRRRYRAGLRARGRTKWPGEMVVEGIGGSTGGAAERNWPAEVPEPGFLGSAAQGRGLQTPIRYLRGSLGPIG